MKMEITRQWLAEHYIEQGMSIRECAKLAHCKRDKIKAALGRYGIERKQNPATPRPTIIINGVRHNACYRCEAIKPIEQFRRDSRAPGGYKAICIDCDKLVKAERRRQNNPDLREYVPIDQRTEYIQQQEISHWMSIRPVILFYWLLIEMCGDEIETEIKARRAASLKAFYRERYSREKQLKQEQLQAEWRKRRSLRRARVKAAPNTLSVEQWAETLRYFDHACCYCGSKADLVQDHVVALVNGGGYVMGNIVPACNHCNNTKHSKELSVWYRSALGFSQARYEKLCWWIESYTAQRQQA